MIGAIVGDVVGSYYEAFPTKVYNFELFHEDSRFTDDTVLSVAVADWLLNGRDLTDLLHQYFARYPQAGYGMSFTLWAGNRKREAYGSWGNGSAMRVSPVGHALASLDEVLEHAHASADVTHNDPEGIKGAQAIAAAIWLAKHGRGKEEIKDYVEQQFSYDCSRKLADIRDSYSFDVSCAGSVPESIIAFLESDSFEDAIRLAISLGGDSDTMGCMAGAIAEAFYGEVPQELTDWAFSKLDPPLRNVVEQFCDRYC